MTTWLVPGAVMPPGPVLHARARGAVPAAAILAVLAMPVTLGARYLAERWPGSAGTVFVILTAIVAGAGVAAVGAGLGAPDAELEASMPRSGPRLRAVHLSIALLAVAVLLGVGQYLLLSTSHGREEVALTTVRNIAGLFGLQALTAAVLGPRLCWVPSLLWVTIVSGGVGDTGWKLVASMPRLPLDSEVAAWTAAGLLAAGVLGFTVVPQPTGGPGGLTRLRGVRPPGSTAARLDDRPLDDRQGSRIRALDALRGFALCGILPANLTMLMFMYSRSEAGSILPPARAVEILAHQRFFPIFSFLFGVSFALVLRSASLRSARPRLVLLRRLLALGLLGVVHQAFHPGEVLLTYAVFGVLVLLPASWLPTWAVLAWGTVGVMGSIIWFGGQVMLVPGLFLLGLGVVRLGLLDSLDQRVRGLAAGLAVVAPAAVAATWWQNHILWDGNVDEALSRAIGGGAGLLGAVAYGFAVLLLVLRSPRWLRTALSGVLEPLGRMALTNYLTATVILLTAGPALGLELSRRYGAAAALMVAILAVQAVLSRWWLARFRYGPLEWCLRCITWWRVVPNR